MGTDQGALASLIAKEEIRELVLLYSRGVDRKDIDLLRSLYAKDATDDHGTHYSGKVEGYLAFLERSFPYMQYSGHHVCNHLISVNCHEGEGEVYALAYHIIPDGKGGTSEDIQFVRYIDRYRKEDGRWLFAARIVAFDVRNIRPLAIPARSAPEPLEDPSVAWLRSRLFARGGRE